MSNEYPSSSRVLQKKPSESAFKQQKLPAWQPILTAGTVLPTFFVIGIAFIPIGVGILFFNSGVQETEIDYTDCVTESGITCAKQIDSFRNRSCICTVPVKLDVNFEGNVFLYYGLTNFYQNHRRYVKSRDDVQLLGKLSSTPSGDCEPYQYDQITKKPIAPCGAIANSMFSDVLRLESIDHGFVPLLKTGIAWPSDKEIKFRNPEPKENLKKAFEGYAKPKDWRQEIWELDPGDTSNNGFQNEDFIVWMRTAALPNFRKLYRRVNHTEEKFSHGLPKGDYLLHVNYNYPVKPFKGTKSLIISTTSVLGAKNPFLGWAYIAVGCLCLIVGVLFLVIHIKYGKSTAEVVNVTPTTSYQ
ncbi:hypothetical protein V9T40_008682 [Parthenolecanium corni]|uniref:Cell cycle control protein 50A n=1 Tax=Parthenolecanium corni TaxID=536013 RepID=A0AAN9TNL0_9HEMI